MKIIKQTRASNEKNIMVVKEGGEKNNEGRKRIT